MVNMKCIAPNGCKGDVVYIPEDSKTGNRFECQCYVYRLIYDEKKIVEE